MLSSVHRTSVLKRATNITVSFLRSDGEGGAGEKKERKTEAEVVG